MTIRTQYLAAAAAIGALAVPAAAQSTFPYQSYPVEQVPQPYPGQPGYGYGQQAFPAYGYGQGSAQNPAQQIIDSLLGNRYNVTDRTAVSQCANAAMVQAQAQYRGYGYNGYGYGQQGYGQQAYGYGQGIAAPAMRVTAITDVQRRSGGLRVKGLISSGYGGQYGGQYGYQDRGYAAGDLSFRCNVAYNGQVTNVRIGRNESYRRY
jgi:hypothetical protein